MVHTTALTRLPRFGRCATLCSTVHGHSIQRKNQAVLRFAISSRSRGKNTWWDLPGVMELTNSSPSQNSSQARFCFLCLPLALISPLLCPFTTKTFNLLQQQLYKSCIVHSGTKKFKYNTWAQVLIQELLQTLDESFCSCSSLVGKRWMTYKKTSESSVVSWTHAHYL